MKPITILNVVRTWAMGGSQTIVLSMLRHLPPERFRMVTAVYETRNGEDEIFAEEAARIGHPVLPTRIPWRSRSGWGRARDVLGTLVREYDAAILHTYDQHSNVLAGLNRRLWPCACVASAHGWWTRVLPLRSHVYEWVEKHVALPRFDLVLTVSQQMKGKITRGGTPEAKVRVIHTGINPEAVQPAGVKQHLREELGIPAEACVAGIVGRIYVEKGHDRLLRAFARIAGECQALHLLVVGQGPRRRALESLAADLGISSRVHFAGYVPDIATAYASMDLFVLPSVLEEGFPTALLEAQAAGLPVIASDIGGTSETMKPGTTGLLVPPKRMDPLADALRALASDGERRRAMGAAARAHISRQFTVPAMVSGVCRAYEEALAIHKGRTPAGPDDVA